jgi:hypothetical protein
MREGEREREREKRVGEDDERASEERADETPRARQ